MSPEFFSIGKKANFRNKNSVYEGEPRFIDVRCEGRTNSKMSPEFFSIGKKANFRNKNSVYKGEPRFIDVVVVKKERILLSKFIKNA